ncbi:SDR family NAD(P)-dependent oxidoreductase [Corynebacterium sphenisci]|uniref:SDR family NAD(P)-dependent oxidoreductase n=1 Tax=Corynebacterium sphenisci TaxID=191493 RepID=UPI0026E09790|nr:SDR family NAD(P)-dependent oxidoreductase [Corynebacterium sphenisci]MDO5730651.1 SDR family NAD(P)-dependent oxidoreductase [Corynebacterium sphenisci]
MFPRIGKRMPRGQRVLITGGASGLGLALTTRFVERGDRVIVADLHDTAPAEVAALGSAVEYRRLDVTSDADWAAAAEAIDSLDMLVLNAGVAVGGRIETVSMETWRRVVDINMLGVVRGARTMAPKLADGGRIAITSSVMGLIHPGFMATYNATKAATVAIGETLHHELSHRGISATTICPQFFRTPLVHSLAEDDAPVNYVARILMTRTWLTVDAVADRAMAAIERRRVVVTPDAAATFTWYSKRFARPAYLLVQRLSMVGARALMRRRFPAER